MKRIFSLAFLTLFALFTPVKGAVVDTLKIHSDKMNIDVDVWVVNPVKKSDKPLPVLYLLHGYSCGEKEWVKKIKPELKEMADRLQFYIVCPDGNDSWYYDIPIHPQFQYETFCSKELVAAIDTKYNTIKDRSGRAISGFSMGGHGALWLAMRHTDVFGAAGSTSGVTDIRPFAHQWGFERLLGESEDGRSVFEEYTVMNQVERLKNGELAIVIDCGLEDDFVEINQDLHNKLMKFKIDHDFILRPGKHNNAYWAISIEYHIIFFTNFFAKGAAK